MRRCVVAILILLLPTILWAQSTVDSIAVTRQCSAIRELVYQATNKQFEDITETEARASYGHQTLGTWQFATTRYNVNFQWVGATICYIEHNEESTDSFRHDTWQYIAEYKGLQNVLDAQRLYRQLNTQIEGCRYPLTDSVDVNFIPLPLDKLPAERPASLEVACVYELPVAGSSSLDPSPLNVMVGMERRQKDYRVSLIVEYKKEAGVRKL
jgi:hypothetical protein